MLILMYLVAIVLANLSVTWFGPASTIINAFVFIGLDLTVRDKLHDKWQSHIKRNMPLLIVAGSALSFLINHHALRIAIASCIAFGLSETIKTIGYIIFKHSPFLRRVTYANIGASFVDSLAFPTIAFGTVIVWAIVGQFFAKVVGGYVWTLVLNLRRRAAPPEVEA